MAEDQTLAQAIDLAREAAAEVAGSSVGDHLGFYLEGDRVGTHMFAALDAGYRGWHWAVTLARAPRSRHATVCEVEMIPGKGALLAPPWLPWAERLQPGDLGPNDSLPYQADDPRLDQGYEQTDDEEADRVAIVEMGLGRARVLSAEGRAAAFTRWYDGDHGPNAPAAKAAKAQCSTCGFFMKLSGAGRRIFGVCANEWSPSDGKIVSVDHGCGAHSETDAPKPRGDWRQSDPVVDEKDLEVVELNAVLPEVITRDDKPHNPESPADEAPAEEAPAEGAEETPDQAPAEDAPADEAPAEETPTEDAPAEEPASEETAEPEARA